MIIDFHTHTFPEKIAKSAILKMQQDSHSAAFTYGTADELKASMSKAGIDFSVVLPVATNPLKVASINEASRQISDNMLHHFGCVHPDDENWYENLKAVAEFGMKGVKIHPVYQKHNIDDVEYLRIFEKCGELGLIVVTHSGNDIGFPGVVKCSPDMIKNAIKQVGDFTLVCAHMGGWKNWDEVHSLAGLKNIYIDTAFSLGEIMPINDGYYSPSELKMLSNEQFISIINTFGSERVLFGTDSPWSDQEKEVNNIKNLKISQDDKENIFYKNALSLLKI